MKRMKYPLWKRCIALWGCAVLVLSANAAAAQVPSEKAGAPAGDKEVREAASRPSGANWSELQRQYRGVFVLSAPRITMRVALTFDDVPDAKYTPLVLNVLRQKKAPATFFIVGSRAQKHPALLRQIVADGHAIGNHSFDHPDLSRLPLAKVKEQIERTGETIRRTVGFEPRFVRPPYGEIGARQLEWAKTRGYTVVNWDVDSSDWRQLGAATVFRNVSRSVRPGSIILLHAGGGAGQNLSGTVRALPRLIDWLRMKDYELVTVPELLGLSESKSGKRS